VVYKRRFTKKALHINEVQENIVLFEEQAIKYKSELYASALLITNFPL